MLYYILKFLKEERVQNELKRDLKLLFSRSLYDPNAVSSFSNALKLSSHSDFHTHLLEREYLLLLKEIGEKEELKESYNLNDLIESRFEKLVTETFDKLIEQGVSEIASTFHDDFFPNSSSLSELAKKINANFKVPPVNDWVYTDKGSCLDYNLDRVKGDLSEYLGNDTFNFYDVVLKRFLEDKGDHLEYKGRNNKVVKVYRGQEIWPKDGHIVIYGYDRPLSGLRNLSFKEIVERVHEAHGKVIVPHSLSRDGVGEGARTLGDIENVLRKYYLAGVDGFELSLRIPWPFDMIENLIIAKYVSKFNKEYSNDVELFVNSDAHNMHDFVKARSKIKHLWPWSLNLVKKLSHNSKS